MKVHTFPKTPLYLLVLGLSSYLMAIGFLNVVTLIGNYWLTKVDPAVNDQQVSFGTVIQSTQNTCLYALIGIPLFGFVTHRLIQIFFTSLVRGEKA